MTSTECPICIESYNKATRSCVQCQFCAFAACRTCTRKYLTGAQNSAHCMGCKKQWAREFIIDNLSRCFINGDYKKQMANLMLETEKSQLGVDMVDAQRVKKRDTIKDNVRFLKSEVLKIQNQIRSNEGELWQIQRILRGQAPEAVVADKREFIRKCPGADCRGMLSTQWKCPICDIKVCAQCHEIKEEPGAGGGSDQPHVCKQENIDSIKFLKKDTKPCPSCGTRIHKIAGCDQMWCVQCKVPYSWRTGSIITHNRFHNPHFIQYQKQLAAEGNVAPGRTPGDVPCGGLPDWYQWRSNVISKHQDPRAAAIHRSRYYRSRSTCLWGKLHDLYRQAAHLQYVIVNDMRVSIAGAVNNKDLRIQFILNKISEKQFKSTIQKRALSRGKKTAMLHIYELLNTVIIENVRSIYSNPEKSNCENCFLRCHRVRVYCNEQLKNISVIYAQTVKLVDPNFEFQSAKYNKKTLQREQKKKAEAAALTGMSIEDVQGVLDSTEAII
jgi:hypothetical protein